MGIALRLPGEPGKVTEAMPKDLDVADVGVGWEEGWRRGQEFWIFRNFS